MELGITLADIRAKIVFWLAMEGPQTTEELCRHDCFQYLAIKLVKIALEELVFERIITAANDRYHLLNR